MSQPQQQQQSNSQKQQQQQQLQQQYGKLLHNTALAALIACPVLALLPPRKLDFYTFGLAGSTLFSANFIVRERTGRPISQYFDPTRQPVQREVQMHDRPASAVVSDEVRNQREAWKLQREREIRGDVEEGKGFGDMIMEQVWEVWNWGRKSEDDEDEG